MSVQDEKAGHHDFGAAHSRSEASIAEAVAELGRLDGAGLRRRWRSLVGSPWPPDLGHALILRVLSYKLQAQRLGDLDRESTRGLGAMTARRLTALSADPAVSTSPAAASAPGQNPPSFSRPPSPARPGTVLVREYGGVRHRVTVLDAGVAWNGKNYDSLSQVALAITGTRWNGPRFFGLRDKATIDSRRSPSVPTADTGHGERLARQAAEPASALSPEGTRT